MEKEKENTFKKTLFQIKLQIENSVWIRQVFFPVYGFFLHRSFCAARIVLTVSKV